MTPPSRIRPADNGIRPATAASRVDFPEPFGPSTASTSPGAAVTGGPQGEAATGHLGVGDEAHLRPGHWAVPPRSHLSRSVTSTTTETSSSTRLSRMAASGSVSSA